MSAYGAEHALLFMWYTMQVRVHVCVMLLLLFYNAICLNYFNVFFYRNQMLVEKSEELKQQLNGYKEAARCLGYY